MAEKKQKKVLIVEDEPTIAKMYSERLSEEGYEIALVTDGEEAIEIVMNENHDLVLLDINLPKKNGLQVIEFIRTTPKLKELPVIVLTAFPKIEYVEAMDIFGTSGFFNKAVTIPKEIVSRINRILLQ